MHRIHPVYLVTSLPKTLYIPALHITHTHTDTHTNTHTQTPTHTHTQAPTHPPTHTHKHTPTHPPTHTHTHTHTQAHTHNLTQTHHTHTLSSSWPFRLLPSAFKAQPLLLAATTEGRQRHSTTLPPAALRAILTVHNTAVISGNGMIFPHMEGSTAAQAAAPPPWTPLI